MTISGTNHSGQNNGFLSTMLTFEMKNATFFYCPLKRPRAPAMNGTSTPETSQAFLSPFFTSSYILFIILDFLRARSSLCSVTHSTFFLSTFAAPFDRDNPDFFIFNHAFRHCYRSRSFRVKLLCSRRTHGFGCSYSPQEWSGSPEAQHRVQDLEGH